MKESPSEAEVLEQLRQFTVVMMRLYSEEAHRSLREAEELIVKGVAMREYAVAMLDRATKLSLDYAEEAAKNIGPDSPREDPDIDW